MRTRSQVVTLGALPDDAFLQVIAACRGIAEYFPLFEAVKGLACSKALLQQLRRLRPLVGVQRLAVMKRPAHGPWCVMLLYEGKLTLAVLEQARQGRVFSIKVFKNWYGAGVTRKARPATLAPAMARHVVPMLLGARCLLLELNLSFVDLNGTWAAIFGEAVVCSARLRRLRLSACGLRGPLPELRLPALQVLNLDHNHFVGGLEPLQGCTALRFLCLDDNYLTGGLEPLLESCTGLQMLKLDRNQLTGGLGPLRGCTELRWLCLSENRLTGGLEPLQACTALQVLYLDQHHLDHHRQTGGLDPLRDCTTLRVRLPSSYSIINK